jgi:hypothetical protein
MATFRKLTRDAKKDVSSIGSDDGKLFFTFMSQPGAWVGLNVEKG